MKRPLKSTLQFFLLAVVTLPVMVDAPKDTAHTQITIWSGFGQYALIRRGCSGEILDEKGIGFQELGAKWSRNCPTRETGILVHAARDHKETGHDVFDSTYGYSWQYTYPHRSTFALNPFVEFKSRYIAMGGGVLISNSGLPPEGASNRHFHPSFRLRLGNPRTFYFDASLFQHPWFFSGNYVRIGIGSNKSPNFQPWGGIGFGPANQPGLLLRSNSRLNQKWTLHLLFRAGVSSSTSEMALGLGLTYFPSDK